MGMFGGMVRFPFGGTIPSLAATVDVPLFRAPMDLTIQEAYAFVGADIASDAVNYNTFQLVNKGLDGNGNTLITSGLGGASSAWTDFVARAFAITKPNNYILKGQVVALRYTKTGTGTFANLCVEVDCVEGKGTTV